MVPWVPVLWDMAPGTAGTNLETGGGHEIAHSPNHVPRTSMLKRGSG